MDKDHRFSKEFKSARQKFGEENVEHGVEFFEDTRYDGVGKIVFKNKNVREVDVLSYIINRSNLKISGGGKVKGEHVHVAKVL